MKKFFTFVAALMAVVAVNATVVTLNPSDFSAVTTAAAINQTVNGITVAIDNGIINDSQIRIYKGKSITLSAASPISAVVFTCTANGTSQYGPGCFEAKDGYSYEGKVGTWVGTPTTSVAFTASTAQVRAAKIEVYLDGETPGTPTPQETVKVDVAGAIAAGQALADGKTSEEVYEVTGFVVNAEAYSTQHKNQIWWMADDAANTGAQEFEAYACTVSESGTIMQVLNGDKVTLTGNITKYIDKNNGNKVIIEIKDGTAVFVSKVDGDHSIDGGVTPPATDLDTITVAKALEIGGQLPSGGKTDVAYVIEGYASSIVQYYDAANDFETFWMTDDKTSTAKTNADGAFEVYKGNPVQKMEVGLHGHVFVTAKITNYNGTIIETSGSASVNIVEQGEVDEVIVATVAEAMAVGKALASGATTEKRYEITGYVSNVYTFYNADYKNETVWIMDDPESTSADATEAFQIYRGKPNTQAEIGYGAKVKVTTTITNYGGTTIESASGVTIEVLEPSTYDPDILTVEEAVEIAQGLAEGAKAPKYSVVKGFIQEAGAVASGVATYKLAQFPNEAEGAVQAYKATILNADAAKLVVNNYVAVTGYLMKKNGGAQIAQGAITAFVEAPKTDTIEVSVTEAIAAGLELPVGGKSDRIYAVTGFVNLVSEEFAEGVESFFLADDAASEAYNFFASAASIDKAVEVGHKVAVIGRLENPDGETVTIDHGQARYIPGEGIENIVLTEKVQKVVVDGAIYIVRDGKMFNLQGAQVR